jgi:hypothetical protein
MGDEMTRAEKVSRITALRTAGFSHAEIASELGMSKSGIRNLLYDPDGAKQHARRKRYQGVCSICGARTDGSNGRASAPSVCAQCAPDIYRIWTRESLIFQIQQFAAQCGRAPHASEWRGPRSSDYPSATSVQEVFGSWANGIEAAGFPRPRVGYYDRRKVAA